MIARIYIAGASKEIERAEWARGALQDLGIGIAYDWPAVIRREGSAEASHTVMQREALAELEAVASCDGFWLLWPGASSPSTGCHAELGMMLMRLRLTPQKFRNTKPIIVSGPTPRKGPFWTLATQNVETDADAVRILGARFSR